MFHTTGEDEIMAVPVILGVCDPGPGVDPDHPDDATCTYETLDLAEKECKSDPSKRERPENCMPPRHPMAECSPVPPTKSDTTE